MHILVETTKAKRKCYGCNRVIAKGEKVFVEWAKVFIKGGEQRYHKQSKCKSCGCFAIKSLVNHLRTIKDELLTY